MVLVGLRAPEMVRIAMLSCVSVQCSRENERRYYFVTYISNTVQWIRGGKVGAFSCNPRSSSEQN